MAEVERLSARHGTEEAAKRLARPIRRDKTTIRALEWVSLDGRARDFWVDFGDGRPVRPVMLALIGVASNHVLGVWAGRIDPDQPAIASTLRLFGRALRGADQIETPALMMADGKIRNAVAARHEAEQQAAIPMEEAA